MSTTLQNKIVTIRKPHQCFSCLRKFVPGVKMNKWVGIYDGQFSSVYSCLTCIDIFNIIQDEDGYPEGYVLEMKDHKDETPEMILERIKTNGRGY